MIRQSEEIVSKSKNIVELMPDIVHFIKCISNGSRSFKENNKEFSGVSILDPIRIKLISSDVSRCLISSKNLNKKNTNEEGTITFEKIMLARMQSIMSHHCGNHKHCRSENCQHKDVKLAERETRGFLHDKNEFPFNTKISFNENAPK